MGKYLAEKHDYKIDLIDNPNDRKTVDSYNHTLKCFQEYKVNKTATKSSIDCLLRKAAKQANDIVLWIESDVSMGDLRDAMIDRVRRESNISHVTLIIDGKDKRYTRDEMITDEFKIKPADLK